MERTEEQKVFKDSLKVILGGDEHNIRPLVIRESREWRQKVAAVYSKLPSYMQVTSDKPEEFSQAISAMFTEMPDMVIDLFFAYAKDLDRDAIEGVATDDEVAKAFEQVMEYAFPLSRSLVGTKPSR